MLDRLPVWIDAFSMARSGKTLLGGLALTGMQRLRPLLTSDDGSLKVELQLGVDAGGTSFLTGTIQGQLQVICQRCLEPVSITIDQALKLGLVREGRESQLAGDYEPLVVGAEPVKLADIIEDELILALPVVAMHPAESGCQPPVHAEADNEQIMVEDVQRENPFAVLSTLKRNTD